MPVADTVTRASRPDAAAPASGERRLRIAFFCSSPPAPPRSGYQLRCFHLARMLADAGHRLHLFGFDPDSQGASALPGLRFESADLVPHRATSARDAASALLSPLPLHVRTHDSAALRAAVRAREPERFDVVYANFMYFAPYRALFPEDALWVVDQHNSDRDVWRSFAAHAPGAARRAYSLLNLAKTRRYERRVYDRADVCVSVSQRDADLTRGASRHPRFVVAPNGVDVDDVGRAAESLRADPRPTILFVGGSAERNVDAVHRLHRRILPRVRRVVPEARLRVAGTVCRDLSGPITRDPAVELAGMVDRIVDAYRGAWVVAVPSSFGGGTKLKMVEGLAAGVPVVGTPNAYQGFDVPAELSELVCEDDAAFAARVAELLGDAERSARLAAAGRRLARAYDWSRTLRPVLEVLRSARRNGAG